MLQLLLQWLCSPFRLVWTSFVKPNKLIQSDGIPTYVPPPPTTEKLDWADLAIIDLCLASTASGREKLANEVRQAMDKHGFFYVVNHGYTLEQTRRIFSLAAATFDMVSDDEKKKFAGQDETVYEGYKPRQTWQIEPGVKDQIEQYNINRLVHKREHPELLQSRISEIEAFAKHNHNHILFTILRIMANAMGLPEEALVEKHKFDSPGHSSVRFMKYYPRTAEEEERTKNVYLRGHTDIGSVTILWSQPISGLQIRTKDNVWRYIRHIENALVVNAGDVMTFLSGGFYKPTIHRVIQPPQDQAHLERLGVFYFSMPSDDTKLAPVGQEGGDAPLMGDWRKERTSKYGKKQLKESPGDVKAVEDVVLGIIVKEYN